MYIDTNAVPEDFDAQDFIKRWSQPNQTPVNVVSSDIINNPTVTMNTGNGFWNQLNTASTNTYPFTDPLEDRINEVEKNLELVRLDNKLLRLKMLSMEGKFTQDEVANIRKMLMSEDEASKTLANTIIENA